MKQKSLPLHPSKEKLGGEGTKVPSFTLCAVESFFIEEKLHELLSLKFQEEGFQDCFLVEYHLLPGNRLELFIDCDSGLTLDKCQKISRFLESHFDEAGWLGESYVLEVSSPGLGRPLKLHRQYVKNIGRSLQLTLEGGEVKTGLLKAVDAESISIEETIVAKEGKKKKKEVVLTEIPFGHIKKAMIVIVF